MRKYIGALTTAVVIAGAGASPAFAANSNRTICGKAWGVRDAVVEKHGKRAPGRNICRYGIKHSGGKVVPAKYSQKVRYLAQLRVLNRPNVAAVPPAQSPGGALSAVTTGPLPYVGPDGTRWAIPWAIVSCESGGSWSAANPSGAIGPYQLLGKGAAWPATSPAAQAEHHRIASALWAGGAGASHWTQCL